MTLYEGRMEGVALQVSIPDDLPLILMDSIQMKRVLINLIDNALEALAANEHALSGLPAIWRVMIPWFG